MTIPMEFPGSNTKIMVEYNKEIIEKTAIFEGIKTTIVKSMMLTVFTKRLINSFAL